MHACRRDSPGRAARPTASGMSGPWRIPSPRPAPRAMGAFTREAQAWLLDAIRHEGLVETPTSCLRFPTRRASRAGAARAYCAATREQAFSVTKVASTSNTSTTPPQTRTHQASLARKNQAMRFGNFPRGRRRWRIPSRVSRADGALPFRGRRVPVRPVRRERVPAGRGPETARRPRGVR